MATRWAGSGMGGGGGDKGNNEGSRNGEEFSPVSQIKHKLSSDSEREISATLTREGEKG